MQRFVLFASLCFALVANYTDGAAVSPDDAGFLAMFTEEELAALRKTFSGEDWNITELTRVTRSQHPHAHLDVVQVVELYDYEIEIHTVKTEDDYVLDMHRITGNRKNPSPKGKRVVFLQHGILCSSMDWVIAGPGRGFAFLLADAGYDVWMGNARGSRYSRRHRSLTVEDPEYWQFDWHEIGSRDLPTMIDHVLQVTKREKLYYIGHSQGTTAFFVMASEHPQYNDKITAAFALAPITYSSRMFSPVIQALSRMLTPLNLLTSLIGVHEFKPTNGFISKFTSLICGSKFQLICSNIMFLITGFNYDQLDMELLPAILAHVPAGAATNQFIHYGQVIHSGVFRQYDLGKSKNLERYNSKTPPNYDIKKVTAPVSLHYSVNDWLSHPTDVNQLFTELPNPIGRFRITHNKFNHNDHLWAKDVKTLVYDKVMNLMKRYHD